MTARGNSTRGTVLLCAGGTGGHLFPAEALALVLQERGWRVELATDHRATTYGAEFPGAATHIVPSATVSGRGPLGKVFAAGRLAAGVWRAMRLIRKVRPAVAVGFGGYPTVPPMLAATLLKVPTIIHDQNAVLGRANRFIAPRATRIATSSPQVKLDAALAAKAVHTGNPVRAAVRAAAAIPYDPPGGTGPLRLLVFGGSQGARFFSEAVPAAVERLHENIRRRLVVVQQVRPEDLEEVREAYRRLGVDAEIAPFFRDLPQRIAASHLVIARGGASTVTELGVIGRPAFYVPLPGAIDQDQAANAGAMMALRGGWMLLQQDATPTRLAGELSAVFVGSGPEKLAAAAANARGFGGPDGAERLADLVEAVAAPRRSASAGVDSPPNKGARGDRPQGSEFRA